MLDFLDFYKYGILFSAVAGGAWAVVHELVKYAVKRWILRINYKG